MASADERNENEHREQKSEMYVDYQRLHNNTYFNSEVFFARLIVITLRYSVIWNAI